MALPALLVSTISASSQTVIRSAYANLHCTLEPSSLSCLDFHLRQAIAYDHRSDWKLVRAQANKDGETYVSIMKTADTLHSDPEFAGLMVRCAPKGKIDVLVVLISPLSPKSQPQIQITAGPIVKTYQGAVTAAGAAVILPDEAGDLAGGRWQRASDLSVTVENAGVRIKGSISLDGLGAAYSNLIRNCSQ